MTLPDCNFRYYYIKQSLYHLKGGKFTEYAHIKVYLHLIMYKRLFLIIKNKLSQNFVYKDLYRPKSKYFLQYNFFSVALNILVKPFKNQTYNYSRTTEFHIFQSFYFHFPNMKFVLLLFQFVFL